jgi:hypothetical protein
MLLTVLRRRILLARDVSAILSKLYSYTFYDYTTMRTMCIWIEWSLLNFWLKLVISQKLSISKTEIQKFFTHTRKERKRNPLSIKKTLQKGYALVHNKTNQCLLCRKSYQKIVDNSSIIPSKFPLALSPGMTTGKKIPSWHPGDNSYRLFVPFESWLERTNRKCK